MTRTKPLVLAVAALLGLSLALDAGPLRAQGAEAPRASEAAADGAGAPSSGQADSPTAIVIHGGAGSIRELDMTDEEERAYRDAMEEALRAGTDVLDGGGSSVEACVQAIQVMEASPGFNAGVGAVLTREGTVEHDASIMDGRTLNAGAVAGVKRLRSPIAAARLVMDSSEHVMLAQEGAETFAGEHGFEMVPNETFITEERRERWEQRREEAGSARGPAADGGARTAERSPEGGAGTGPAAASAPGDHLGTVGCAALDRDGDLAAGTSTGGISDKRFGRIGDSPIVGAGTYADNETAALSATGHGEYFIRLGVTHDIVSMMRYANMSLSAATAAVVHGRLEELGPGATGGVIGMDGDGDIAVTFNTPGMFRAWVDTEGEMVVEFFRD
jgi:beta-aspartyl-peptidase (threonine type)